MNNKQGKLILGSYSPEQKQSAVPAQPQGEFILEAQLSPTRLDNSSSFSQSIIVRVRKRRAAYVSLTVALSILVLTIVLSTQLIFANTTATSPRQAIGPIHPTIPATATATLPNNYKDMVSFLIAQGRLLYYGNPNLPEIALTFDDGPGTYTSQVLSILHKYALQASFFNIGENVPIYPDAINQVHAAGYPIGDHTWDHRDLTKLSEANIQSELLRASDAIKSAIGVAPTLFRPPYGSMNDHVLRVMYRLGFTTVMWSVDSEDWKVPGVNTIVRNVLSEVSNGSIILMHDAGGYRSQTLAALPRIISTLLSRGYRFVTIPQMIQHLARDSKNRVIENQPSNTSPFPPVPPGGLLNPTE